MQVEMYPGNESRHKLNLGKKQRVELNTFLSQYNSSKGSFYVLDIFFGFAKPLIHLKAAKFFSEKPIELQP